MAPRREKRRYGLDAKDVRRGGIGPASIPTAQPYIKQIDTWLRVDGADVPYSNAVQTITDENNTQLLAGILKRETHTFEHTLELTSGDYVEFMFMVNDLDLYLRTQGVGINHPATPSISVEVEQVI